MKTRAFLLHLFAVLPLVASAGIYSETFETPTGQAYEYPATQGYKSHLQDRVSAWAGNAVVKVTYADGLGTDGSGGIRFDIVKAGTDYAVLNLRLPLDARTHGVLTVEKLENFVVSFDVKGANSLSIAPAIQPAVKAPWSVRLAMPEVLLSSRWNPVRLVFANAKPEALAALVETYNAGGKAELVLGIYVKDLVDWAPGDSFQIDNLELTGAAR